MRQKSSAQSAKDAVLADIRVIVRFVNRKVNWTHADAVCDEGGCRETRGLEMDHIHSRHPYGHHFLIPGWCSPSNLQMLCHKHHAKKTDSKSANRGDVRDRRCQLMRLSLGKVEEEIYDELGPDHSVANIARVVREIAEKYRFRGAV